MKLDFDSLAAAYWNGRRSQPSDLCPYSYFGHRSGAEELAAEWWRGRRDAAIERATKQEGEVR